jgi:hypothetical protein
MNRNWRRGFNDVEAAIAAQLSFDTLITDVLDLHATSTDNVLTPIGKSDPTGFLFLPVTTRWIIRAGDLDGTITTGPTANAGNNPAKTNVLLSAVQLTAANMNTMFTSGLPNDAGAANTTNLTLAQLFDGANPFKMDITVACAFNTATKAKARWAIVGAWVPA